MDFMPFLMMIAKMLLVIIVVLSVVPIMVWFERRGSAWMQGRVGPHRVGPFGLLQPLADVFKFFCKEDFTPKNANKFFYYLAPIIALIAPLCAMCVLPFGSKMIVDGQEYLLSIAPMDTGVIFILAFAGLEVYPIILAGWASKNKYSVLGSLRGSSQIVSYEISMGLALLSQLIIFGSFNPFEMVEWQTAHYWGVLVNPIGALVFYISIFAETNRLPFDLPEGESELVAGYHLEYGAMKFALFFMAEYIAMLMVSWFISTVFFGGYGLLPGMQFFVDIISNFAGFAEAGRQNVKAVFEMISICTKIAFFMFAFVWVRWTLPRFRFDQLMNLGWKILFPLSLVNLVVVTIAVYFFNR
jgi:NADH-quinone oxidoreductase subunit H